MLSRLSKLLENRTRALMAVLALSTFLTVSAFVIEYYFGAKPCEMCWWQRYTHWAIGGLAVLGLVMRGRITAVFTIFTCLCVAVVSWGIGLWQSLAQYDLVELPSSCAGNRETAFGAAVDLLATLNNTPVNPSCDEVGFSILSLSLAEWNVIVMSALIVYLLAVLCRK